MTWELPQQLIGVGIGIGLNMKGDIENISTLQGATLIETKSSNWGAFTLGSVIVAKNGTLTNNSLFQHEYGHYLQSRLTGPTQLFVALISIVSFHKQSLSNHHNHWTESWANSLSKEHFGTSWKVPPNHPCQS